MNSCLCAGHQKVLNLLRGCTVTVTYSRCQCSDSQPAEHVSLVADPPQRNHIHAALSRTRQDGHVAQWDGWDFLPGTCGSQFTLPVQEKGKKAGKDTAGQ